MLRGLDITDMLIIDRLELTFQPGLNVLTGETGAGKSILLDALGFVLGWRGRAELVRQGAEQGEVTAAFEVHERALMDNDTGVLNELFWEDSRTIRYGIGVNGYSGTGTGFISPGTT